MIQLHQVKARLEGAIQLAGLGSDRERVAMQVVGMLVPEVLKLIKEEVRAANPRKAED